MVGKRFILVADLLHLRPPKLSDLWDGSQAQNYMELCLVVHETLTMKFGKFFNTSLHLLM